MQRQFDFEQDIKNVLETECGMITASPDLKKRIDDQIVRSQKEDIKMKHLSVKKLVIGVAVGCLLVSGGVFAAGHAVSHVTHRFWPDAYRSFGDLEKAEERLGYTADAVEAFSNGYRFKYMFVDDWQGMDEAGNEVYTYKSLDITYGKRGEEEINLSIEKPVETPAQDHEPDAVKKIGDITANYETITFKFVPPSYELTDEDRANDARPDYTISVGSDEVMIKLASYVTWEKDGIQYKLYGFDLSLSADEMFDMAEEIIGY